MAKAKAVKMVEDTEDLCLVGAIPIEIKGAPKPNKTEMVTLGHRGYLAKFGLTAETIKQGGLYSLRRGKKSDQGEIFDKLGTQAFNIWSAFAFPYHNCDGFERFLVWRCEKWGNPSFTQLYKTPKHLYVPSSVDLKGHSQLFIAENEIGTLALRQAGFQAVGLGALWDKGWPPKEPDAPDFDKIAWEWLVLVVISLPAQPHIPDFPYHLAKMLSRRGAWVLTLFLPPHKDDRYLLGKESLQEQEVEIFLANRGAEEFNALANQAWWFDPSWTKTEAYRWWWGKLKNRGIWPEELFKLPAYLGGYLKQEIKSGYGNRTF
jgi:hypothetical protein